MIATCWTCGSPAVCIERQEMGDFERCGKHAPKDQGRRRPLPPQPILAAVADEMRRQREIHPDRPRHPYHWHTVFGEEALEALVEIARLTQDFATGATVDTRLDTARRLRTELVQVAAVAAAWAETLPGSTETARKGENPEKTSCNPSVNPIAAERL